MKVNVMRFFLTGVVSAIAMLASSSQASATLAKSQMGSSLNLKFLSKGGGLSVVSSEIYQETLAALDEVTTISSTFTSATFTEGMLFADVNSTVAADGLGYSSVSRQVIAVLYPLRFDNSSNIRQFISIFGSGSAFASAFGTADCGSAVQSTSGFTWSCERCDVQTFEGVGASLLLFSGGLYRLPPGELSETKSFSKQLDVNIDPGGYLNIVALANGNTNADSFIGSAVPEPATWVMLIAGFGAVGGVARRRRSLAPT